MPEFYLVGLVLVLLASCFVIFPLLINHGSAVFHRRNINVDLFKERLGELQNDLSADLISNDEFAHLKMELERRLLEDTKGDESVVIDSAGQEHSRIKGKPPAAIVFAMALVIPLLSYLTYQQLGAKPDWDITNTLEELRHASAGGQNTDDSMELLLSQLNSRLEQRPDNAEYLMTLASVQMEKQQYSAAADSYRRLAIQFPQDPSVLGRYAQALYLAENRKLSPKVTSIAEQALAIDPNQSAVLGMMGIASFESRDYQSAITYWSRLLQSMAPGSSNRQMIAQGVAEAKKLLLESGGVVSKGNQSLAGIAMDSNKRGGEVSTAAISVEVSLDEEINNSMDPQTAIFVFARAASGPPMPLAVARLTVADLPATIQLNDAMAMTPTMKISNFDHVNIVARVSLAGTAKRASGDVEGVVGPIKVSSVSDPVSIVINQLVP